MLSTNSRTSRKSAFTLVEILIVIAILAILAVVTFVVINPAQRINDSNDARRREEVNSILGAINLYQVDNNGAAPTAGGLALPAVTAANIITNGVNATTLDGVAPTHVASIPTDPTGVQYKVGLIGSSVMVGITLSNGTIFTATN